MVEAVPMDRQVVVVRVKVATAPNGLVVPIEPAVFEDYFRGASFQPVRRLAKPSANSYFA